MSRNSLLHVKLLLVYQSRGLPNWLLRGVHVMQGHWLAIAVGAMRDTGVIDACTRRGSLSHCNRFGTVHVTTANTSNHRECITSSFSELIDNLQPVTLSLSKLLTVPAILLKNQDIVIKVKHLLQCKNTFKWNTVVLSSCHSMRLWTWASCCRGGAPYDTHGNNAITVKQYILNAQNNRGSLQAIPLFQQDAKRVHPVDIILCTLNHSKVGPPGFLQISSQFLKWVGA